MKIPCCGGADIVLPVRASLQVHLSYYKYNRTSFSKLSTVTSGCNLLVGACFLMGGA